jgi:hypothetical protein
MAKTLGGRPPRVDHFRYRAWPYRNIRTPRDPAAAHFEYAHARRWPATAWVVVGLALIPTLFGASAE